jgi:hypothetical protein
MTRLLRFALLAVAISTMSAPAFALHCFTCDELGTGTCDPTPDSGTRCHFTLDGCVTVDAPFCTGVVDQDTLADKLAIASVDVVTPAGATTSSSAQRVAERRPAPRAAAVSSFSR